MIWRRGDFVDPDRGVLLFGQEVDLEPDSDLDLPVTTWVQILMTFFNLCIDKTNPNLHSLMNGNGQMCAGCDICH